MSANVPYTGAMWRLQISTSRSGSKWVFRASFGNVPVGLSEQAVTCCTPTEAKEGDETLVVVYCIAEIEGSSIPRGDHWFSNFTGSELDVVNLDVILNPVKDWGRNLMEDYRMVSIWA
ncbi:hypothetical protein ARMGADRAFT_1100258 [Armillaria gallica]|uniref:Uncharacterized protein n=1 Tax=Armillaria gallica TaxID=47427 RepID=A0A2H3CSN1_ARMGA|nr:hypothetical protein ARMGADRAFT_1040817 [Armillaria gallica]PBK79747.1 hypothetical protein ARMGADRAFT_1100258 [Armillaria gallica]